MAVPKISESSTELPTHSVSVHVFMKRLWSAINNLISRSDCQLIDPTQSEYANEYFNWQLIFSVYIIGHEDCHEFKATWARMYIKRRNQSIVSISTTGHPGLAECAKMRFTAVSIRSWCGMLILITWLLFIVKFYFVPPVTVKFHTDPYTFAGLPSHI